jgi:hypothetical protein
MFDWRDFGFWLSGFLGRHCRRSLGLDIHRAELSPRVGRNKERSNDMTEKERWERKLKEILSRMTPEMLAQLAKALPAIARRAHFKLIKGGRKDEPKPATLKGEFDL